MNINEQMNQLGRIGSVGYAPTDDLIDSLLAKTKRARAVRQGSAAVVGSVSAVALGLVGVQVYVAIDHRNDAATQDRNLDNGLPSLFDFDSKYGGGYTGVDEATRDSLDKIYADLRAAAEVQAKHLAEQKAAEEAAAAAAAAAATGTADTGTGTATGAGASCTYEEKSWEGGIKYRSPDTGCAWTWKVSPPSDPSTFDNPWEGEATTCGTDGTWAAPGGVGYYNCSTGKWSFAASYFMFGNGEVYKCENWTDYATGVTFQGAISNNPVSGSNNGGWEDKRIACTVGKTYRSTVSDYWYMGSELKSSTGNVCKGATINVWGAQQRYSCLREDELWANYGTWSADLSGGNHPWTQNNGYRKILVDEANFKWFTPCGRYYDISSSPTDGWYWNGSSWAEVVVTPPPADPPTA